MLLIGDFNDYQNTSIKVANKSKSIIATKDNKQEIVTSRDVTYSQAQLQVKVEKLQLSL